MKNTWHSKAHLTFRATPILAGLLATVVGCGSVDADGGDETLDVSRKALENRAYVVSELSDDLFIVDLKTMKRVGQVDTNVGRGVNGNHMAVLSKDGAKLFITATNHASIAVVDTVAQRVVKTIKIGPHNTHSSACFGCGPGGRDELWVVNEGDDQHPGSISVIDMKLDREIEKIEHPSFVVPHNIRFAGRKAYVPSIGGNQISVVDRDNYQVTEVLLLKGEIKAGACSADPCGYADAQIDGNGVLFAAHIESGSVIAYDTRAEKRLADIPMGYQPWAVFVDELSNDFDTHLMPNWGDSTVSIMDRKRLAEISRSPEGDMESYGINYSPRAPGEAFVLNRIKEAVSVIDRESGDLIERIDVGGTTETAATTEDGKYLLLPISSANAFAVYDVETREQVQRFEGVGKYPWSVTTLGGQNYCH
jgi:DNA-binding beta-propeller fold protein YncE